LGEWNFFWQDTYLFGLGHYLPWGDPLGTGQAIPFFWENCQGTFFTKREMLVFYFPLATCILLSILLTIILKRGFSAVRTYDVLPVILCFDPHKEGLTDELF